MFLPLTIFTICITITHVFIGRLMYLKGYSEGDKHMFKIAMEDLGDHDDGINRLIGQYRHHSGVAENAKREMDKRICTMERLVESPQERQH